MNRVIVLIFCVCFTNGKDMALQRQIWSTFVTVLWVRKTEIQDRAGILVLVRVLWVRIPKIYWQFWQSFFKYSFKSSSNFYPIGITWRKMARAVCLQPVSMETWRLHTLWRFTVPAYRQQHFVSIGKGAIQMQISLLLLNRSSYYAMIF